MPKKQCHTLKKVVILIYISIGFLKYLVIQKYNDLRINYIIIRKYVKKVRIFT